MWTHVPHMVIGPSNNNEVSNPLRTRHCFPNWEEILYFQGSELNPLLPSGAKTGNDSHLADRENVVMIVPCRPS